MEADAGKEFVKPLKAEAAPGQLNCSVGYGSWSLGDMQKV